MKKIAVPFFFDHNGWMNQNSELLFTLKVRIPEQPTRDFEVVDRVLAGIDPRNDLILVDPKVEAKHFLFRNRNNVFTVHYLGLDGETFLNGLPLEKGKLYMLDKGDSLKVGKIEITVGAQKSMGKPIERPLAPAQTLPPLTKIPQESEEFKAEAPAPQKLKKNGTKKSTPILRPKIKATAREPFFDFRTVSLIPYKFYGFIVDIALTYLVLALLLPSLGVMALLQDFLYPISEYVSQYLLAKYPLFPTIKILSLIEFFICFHFLMVASSLILGTTPGAFLVGVHPVGKNNFLAVRFKAYIYALLNIVALPLLLFDIPFYKGKNIKEMLTFSLRGLNTSILFRLSRKAVTPLVIVSSMLSPFFLNPPYTASFTSEKLTLPKYIDTHSTHFSSYSREFGFSLSTNLSQGIAILPYFEKKKLGLLLYDFSAKKTLIMKEATRTSNEQAFYKFRYANPLASLNFSAEQIENESLKHETVRSLELSLANLAPGFLEFGPFLAGAFLMKEEFLKNFSERDNFLYNSFELKNPALKIAASTKGNKKRGEEKVFLFSRKGILEFSLVVPQQTKLLEHLVNSILAPLRFDQSSNNGLKDPQILEVLEAFERSNYQTLLTYYINEAKKAQELQNPEWQALIRKNLEQTKRALFEDETRTGLTKNIEKSFDDIINTL